MNDWLTGKNVLVVGSGDVAATAAAAVRAAGATCHAAAVWVDATAPSDLDALVHAGHSWNAGSANTLSRDGWHATQSADIDGRFLAAAEFARRRFAAGRPGSILMLAPAAGDVARLTANGAIENLVKSLAVEWARDGVRTNAIMSRTIGADGKGAEAARAALGNLVVWLLGDYAVYVNGSIMGIDETDVQVD